MEKIEGKKRPRGRSPKRGSDHISEYLELPVRAALHQETDCISGRRTIEKRRVPVHGARRAPRARRRRAGRGSRAGTGPARAPGLRGAPRVSARTRRPPVARTAPTARSGTNKYEWLIYAVRDLQTRTNAFKIQHPLMINTAGEHFKPYS